jgi:predicted nucleotide-binding protein (sugar kinase/HSP70/actin superfamily)
MRDTKVTFPHLGNYCVPLAVLFKEGVGVDYVTPPPITQKTLEIGSKHSPDFVCSPFKYNLGNYIESIEAGANTLVQVGGACRLQYYGELHEQILRDLGYEFQFVNLANAKLRKLRTLINPLLKVNPQFPIKKVAQILPMVVSMAKYIDETEDFIRKNIGFEVKKGSFDRYHRRMLDTLRNVKDKKELAKVTSFYTNAFRKLPVDMPENPLRVGVIGEYYTIMEPFSNHFIEKELASMGIVVDRWMSISHSMLMDPKKEKERKSKYTRYDMGATCRMTIDRAEAWAKKKYDGIIHVKSFGCTPETDVIPVLQNISEDYGIPILYFSFDSQTSETGIRTRLEAFNDMIIMRKDRRK